MIADLDTDLLTVAEAARLLRVSPGTVRRWVRAGRLPASRTGARACRLQRADVENVRILRSAGDSMPVQVNQVIHTSLDTLGPYTDERQRQAYAAYAAACAHIAHMHDQRGAMTLDESWPIIREEREARSQQLQ